MVEVLLRADRSFTRTERERIQADEIYKGSTLRVSFRAPVFAQAHVCASKIPYPREASPPPAIPTHNPDYARPCPHCLPGNQYGWRCPQPIRDADIDPDGAWHLDDGTPPGHAYCGHWLEAVL
jgi:E3 ubiquitin-protein ligase CHFR